MGPFAICGAVRSSDNPGRLARIPAARRPVSAGLA